MADTEESLVAPSLLMKMGPWRYPFFLVDKICEFKRGCGLHHRGEEHLVQRAAVHRALPR